MSAETLVYDSLTDAARQENGTRTLLIIVPLVVLAFVAGYYWGVANAQPK